MKKIIKERITSFNLYDFDTTIENIISKLEPYADGKHEADVETVYDYGYEEKVLVIYKSREETDDECQNRLDKIKQQELVIRKKEQKEYERLKKKFEND